MGAANRSMDQSGMSDTTEWRELIAALDKSSGEWPTIVKFYMGEAAYKALRKSCYAFVSEVNRGTMLSAVTFMGIPIIVHDPDPMAFWRTFPPNLWVAVDRDGNAVCGGVFPVLEPDEGDSV
jgi:hypothetical protein